MFRTESLGMVGPRVCGQPQTLGVGPSMTHRLLHITHVMVEYDVAVKIKTDAYLSRCAASRYLPRARDEDGVRGRAATAEGHSPLTPPAVASMSVVTVEHSH